MRHIKIFYTIAKDVLMPFISFFVKRFFDDRSLEEHRSFEIYLKLLTIEYVTKDDQKKLAKFAYKAAKHFAEAIDDETIGIEDIAEKLKLLRDSGGVDLRS